MISIEDFNKITDLRVYFLHHPDKEMVRTSCLHFLGDKFQKFAVDSEQSELKEVEIKAQLPDG